MSSKPERIFIIFTILKKFKTYFCSNIEQFEHLETMKVF